ncbi:hypothetical protein [Dysgonomonas alginatilytica]|uniref:hypothetical protein n=1 Tax=Dysgonomonas alginatilytica TaxID=1605892 RepID=UPI001474327E|nr:hypothetical protein [Dysgonomonas alginatilytica]
MTDQLPFWLHGLSDIFLHECSVMTLFVGKWFIIKVTDLFIALASITTGDSYTDKTSH